MNKESEFEELLESAYRHIKGELGLEYVKLSLRSDFQNLKMAHDAIHESLSLASLLIALPAGHK